MSFVKLYLTTKYPVFTPSNFRGSWSDVAGSTTHVLEPSKIDGGIITSISRAETSASATHSVLLYRGVSGPLAGQTISGTLDVTLGVVENHISTNFAYHIHAYATSGDTDTVRGTLLNDYVETLANEWPIPATGLTLSSAQSLSSLSVSAGDRLVVEIGYRALNTDPASVFGSLYYGTQDPSDLSEAPDLANAGVSVSTFAGFLSFSNTIDEQALETKVSQLPIELYNSGSGEIVVSQLPIELYNTGSKAINVSQLPIELYNSGTKETKISQLLIEVWSQNIAATNPYVQCFVIT